MKLDSTPRKPLPWSIGNHRTKPEQVSVERESPSHGPPIGRVLEGAGLEAFQSDTRPAPAALPRSVLEERGRMRFKVPLR